MNEHNIRRVTSIMRRHEISLPDLHKRKQTAEEVEAATRHLTPATRLEFVHALQSAGLMADGWLSAAADVHRTGIFNQPQRVLPASVDSFLQQLGFNCSALYAAKQRLSLADVDRRLSEVGAKTSDRLAAKSVLNQFGILES
jgi:hypothetical protein